MRALHIVTIWTFGLILCACTETATSRYANLTEARKAGAIDRGWVPSILPESSTEVIESHNLDTNQTWGSFRFSQEEEAQFRSALVPANVNGQVLRRPTGVNEWPGFLQGELSMESLHKAGYESYKVATETLFFAIRWQDGRAFYWRTAL